jgi:hypothetical protein
MDKSESMTLPLFGRLPVNIHPVTLWLQDNLDLIDLDGLVIFFEKHHF